MNLDKLLSYYSGKGITANDIAAITEAFTSKKMVKGEYFAEEGKTSRHLALSQRGYSSIFILKTEKRSPLTSPGKIPFFYRSSVFTGSNPPGNM